MNALKMTRCYVFALVTASALIGGNAQSQEKISQSSKSARQKSAVLAPVEDIEGLPRVLLIGDSISMGYTLPVRDLLKGKANVHRPLVNCGPTTRGVEAIDQWLGKGKWDVIHFNFGLHDLKYVGTDGVTLAKVIDGDSRPQVSIEDYEKNLRQLVERLKQTQSHLIWRNTTPVPERSAGRIAKDEVRYNAVAEKVMRENGIEIHDLHAFVISKADSLMLPQGNVHFTNDGYQQLAEEVASIILASLKTK